MHVLRERFEHSALKERANAHARAYKATKIVIEDAGAGTYLIQELHKLGLRVVAVRPERDKKTRLLMQLAKFEAGLVFFPRQAPWLPEYEAEIFAFPNVRFDDQVDSTSQALAVDPSGFDLGALAAGMGRLAEGLAFKAMFPW